MGQEPSYLAYLKLAATRALDNKREIVARWTQNKRAASAAVFLSLGTIRIISACW